MAAHTSTSGVPLSPLKPRDVQTLSNPQVSTVGTGTLIGYTVPAATFARLVFASLANITGTPPTVALQYLNAIGGVNTIFSGTVQQFIQSGMWLLTGETVRWNCTVGGAASTVDVVLSIEEYDQE